MARPVIDIRVLGDKALERTLVTFAENAQRIIVRGALRKSAKRVHPAIIQAFSGIPVGVQTGRTLIAMIQNKPVPITRLFKKGSGRIGFGIPWPTREELGIDPKDEHFYPSVLEYGGTIKTGPRKGTHIPAKMPIRGTVNRMERAEKRQIGDDIKKGIERRWKREMKKLGRKIA